MRIKITSSLEKVFLDSSFSEYEELKKISCLKGERLSLQVVYTPEEYINRFELSYIRILGDLAPYAKIWKVKSVGNEYPVYADAYDDNYLRTAPGLYPDLLEEVYYKDEKNPYGLVRAGKGILYSLWIEIDIPKDDISENHNFKIVFDSIDIVQECEIDICVIPFEIPKQKLIYTEWFHCDCLANYYDCDVWSDKHFEIIKNFVRIASRNGINMLLVPVFTPPLDTAVGGERKTNQLVKITKIDDEYKFDYSLLDRFLDLIKSEGIEYYEIAHLFTQWGAYNAPKVVASVNGKEEVIFSWSTDAHDEKYVSFLRQFLSSFISHMKERGEDKKCYYHISDEPNEKHLESYKKAKESVSDLLKDYVIMDALSNYEFYEQHIVDTPIPSSDHIQPFIDNKVENLWTYYCCGQCIGVSNRLISMPSYRTRFIGFQMFKYDIVGFLQWGYNFYNNRFSCDEVLPYVDLSGDVWVPGGDTFSVYPGKHGVANESIRLKVFYEGINDIRACELCAELYGKEKVIEELEKIYGKEIEFSDCTHDSKTLIQMRERINEMILDKTKE